MLCKNAAAKMCVLRRRDSLIFIFPETWITSKTMKGMKHLIKFSVTMNHFDHWKRLTIDKTTWKSSCRWTGIYHPTKVRWRRWQHPKLQPWLRKNSQIDCRWICGTVCWLCESVFTHSLWCYTLALAEPLKQHESFKNDKRKHIESFFELLIRTKKTFWKMICAELLKLGG